MKTKSKTVKYRIRYIAMDGKAYYYTGKRGGMYCFSWDNDAAYHYKSAHPYEWFTEASGKKKIEEIANSRFYRYEWDSLSLVAENKNTAEDKAA